MDKLSVVVMEKDAQTGLLDKELGSYSIEYNIDYIDKVFAVIEEGREIVHLYLTIPGEFEDWEFNAILDNYDTSLYDGLILSIEEDQDNHNPGWILKVEFIEDDDKMEERLNNILKIHDAEAARVTEEIKGMKDEYIE
ncbi:MAG: hypothetical protein QME45_13415 [Clostridiales bacterium]|nr:hypothetical protein [Clostridiales bacterium]